MTPCLQTFAKISLGLNICMSCLLQVYVWKIVWRQKIIFLGKKKKPKNQPNNKLKTQTKTRHPFEIQVITKEMQNMY